MLGPRRKILVTGATDGIGRALVGRLAPRHDVIATGRRPAHETDFPENVTYLRADQAEPDEAAREVEELILNGGWPHLDYAVLNAGTGFSGTPQSEPANAIRLSLDVNLTGTILLAHTLYPWLQKAGGQLTLVGSTARRGSPDFASYAATKAGLHGFARALREEWRGRVRVQVVHPGPTMTDMHTKAGFDPGWIRQWFIRPAEMAAMLEAAMRAGHASRTLSFPQYLAGASILGRTIR